MSSRPSASPFVAGTSLTYNENGGQGFVDVGGGKFMSQGTGLSLTGSFQGLNEPGPNYGDSSRKYMPPGAIAVNSFTCDIKPVYPIAMVAAFEKACSVVTDQNYTSLYKRFSHQDYKRIFEVVEKSSGSKESTVSSESSMDEGGICQVSMRVSQAPRGEKSAASSVRQSHSLVKSLNKTASKLEAEKKRRRKKVRQSKLDQR